METDRMSLEAYKRRHIVLSCLLLGAASLIGCTVGPNYKRPAVDVPGAYRGARLMHRTRQNTQSEQTKPEQKPTEATAQSLGDEKWWEVFQDPELQALIRTALKNNYDVRIAATRVLQARAQLGITHADQLPSLGAGGNISSQQNPQDRANSFL